MSPSLGQHHRGVRNELWSSWDVAFVGRVENRVAW